MLTSFDKCSKKKWFFELKKEVTQKEMMTKRILQSKTCYFHSFFFGSFNLLKIIIRYNYYLVLQFVKKKGIKIKTRGCSRHY